MTLSSEISVGDVLHGLEIIVILVGGLRVSYTFGKTYMAIEASIQAQAQQSLQQTAQIDDLKIEIRSINLVLKEVAIQDSRLNRTEADIADLRRGQGMNTEVWTSVLEGAVGRAIASAQAK